MRTRARRRVPGRSERRRRSGELAGLRTRIAANMFSTADRLEARQRASMLSGVSAWLSPTHEQTVSYAIWFAALAWELTHEFLEGNSDGDEVPFEVVSHCEQMSAVADTWTDFSVRAENQVADVASIPPVSLQPFRAPVTTAATARGLWRMADAIGNRVEHDWNVLTLSDLPRRFAMAERLLLAALRPNLELMKYLRDQELFATDISVYVNLAQRSLAPADGLFQVGQKIWAPYLIGPAYAQART
jgi:hypothetical protein